MSDKILLNELNYNQRRIVGQLCALPSAWAVAMDDADEEVARSLIPYGFVNYSYSAEHVTAIELWQATDRGRHYWKQFTDQGARP